MPFVHFNYIGVEPFEDSEFDAECEFLPRVGDLLFGKRGEREFTVVRRVLHRMVKLGDKPFFQQVTTVILADPAEAEKGGGSPPQ